MGSGSVLLNHYSPFKVAEVFSTLEELFPGRIDMGIGRATTGPVTDIALQRNRSYRQTSDDSGEQLAELLAWMENGFEPKHPFSQVTVYKQPPRILAGTPEKVGKWLTEIAAAYGAEEIMVQCITSNHQGRSRSHRLLAEHIGLKANG